MVNKAINVILLAVALLWGAGAQAQSVGLVLSGGGAKGIAHIGVIQALEENGIPIDYVTGTSMGAIVGGLYAAGYSPKEMLALIASKGFRDWSTGTINNKLTYYFLRPKPSPALFNINLGENKHSQLTSVLPMSLINPLPMNLAFVELFTPYTAQCGADFDRLFVPFRCVTSNVYAKHKVVLRGGSLGDAVRMSMSFPVVFHPIMMDSIPMYDGGIYDNFPVDVMVEDFNPDKIIGIDVSTPTPPDARSMMAQLEMMIMQPDDYPFPYDKGVYIHMDLNKYSLLDFGQYQAIYDFGYRRAVACMDSIKALVGPRRADSAPRRAQWKRDTPQVRFATDSVRVDGGTKRQNEYLRSMFVRRGQPATFGLDALRRDYYRAISPEQIQNLVPYPIYNRDDSTFSLDLDAVVRRRWNLAIGSYLSSSTNSMLYLAGGYGTLNHNAADVGLRTWIGQTYLAADIGARLQLDTENPSALSLHLVADRKRYDQSASTFFDVHVPDFVSKSRLSAEAAYSLAAGRSGIASFGAGYGYLHDRYYENLHKGDGRRDIYFNLWEGFAKYEYSTLNRPFYPTSGAQYVAEARGVLGRHDHGNMRWAQARLQSINYFATSRHFSLGTQANALLSSRPLIHGYAANVVSAPSFNPTPESYNAFNRAFHANSYVTAGLMPVYLFGSGTLQLRGQFHAFVPLRRFLPDATADKGVRYGDWLGNVEFFGSMAAVVSLPWASVSAFGNYLSKPARNWSFGISLGFFMEAPKFLGN